MPISKLKPNFFEAVLFDMDGTLVDTEPLWLKCETELTGKYGYLWRQSDQAHCLGGPLDRVGKYMSDLTGAMSPEFFTNTLISLMADELHCGAPLMSGAPGLLELFQSWSLPMALVSASPRILVDAVLDSLPGHGFQVSISSDDVEKVKPHPEGYLSAANHLGVPIANCLILEDSLTGVTAAIASGGYVIAVPHLVEIGEGPRVEVVQSLSKVTSLFLQALGKKWLVN